MDQQFSQPKPVKPANNSKPPMKSWSELLSPVNTSINTSVNSTSNTSGNISANNTATFVSVKQPSISSGSNSAEPSRPSSAMSLEINIDSLKLSRLFPDSEFLYAPLNYLQSRPIVNPGNRCYMIAVLQVLLHSRLFSNYMQKYFFKLDLIDSILTDSKYPLLRALKNFYRQFANVKETTSVSFEVIDEIFIALKTKSCFSAAGFAEQEDAEEFLTALLDSLGDEFLWIQAQNLVSFSLPFDNGNGPHESKQEASDDNWLQVGPKQRVATTRRTPVSQSPIHALFAGSFQSLYRAPGTRPSITFEPFTILPLSVVTSDRGDVGIDSITGAIDHVLRCEDLGRKCSKQLSFSSLPPLLIIQLKRFIYKQTTPKSELELHKITRPLKIPLALNLQQNTYRLYAGVNHHGGSLNAGHYTATIHKPDGSWCVFDDDSKVQKVNESAVLNQNSSVYLLFYERQQQQ